MPSKQKSVIEQILEDRQNRSPVEDIVEQRQRMRERLDVPTETEQQAGEVERPSFFQRLLRGLGASTPAGLPPMPEEMADPEFRAGFLNAALKIADYEEKPWRIARNLLAVDQDFDPLRPTHGKSLWEMSKQAVKDGWQGKEYRATREIAARYFIPDDTIQAYHDWVNKRHPVIKYADKANEIGVDIAISILADVAAGTLAAKGFKSLNFAADFATISQRAIKGSFDDAMDKAAKRVTDKVPLQEQITRQLRPEEFQELGRLHGITVRPDRRVNSTLYDFTDRVLRYNPDKIDEATTRLAMQLEDEGVEQVLFHKAIDNEARKIWVQANIDAKIVSRKQVNQMVDSLTFGQAKKVDELTDAQLKSLIQDIDALKKAPEKWKWNFFGRRVGGVPSWKVFENMGVPRFYDIIDEAVYTHDSIRFARSEWVDNVVKNFQKTHRKWDDKVDEIAARMADEGPDEFRAKMRSVRAMRGPTRPDPDAQAVQRLVADFSDDELNAIEAIVREDKELFWEPLADLAQKQGKIGPGTGVPREEWYYHHRTKVVEGLRELSKTESGRKGLFPTDYAIEKIMRRKIPKRVNVPEFFARKDTLDEISYKWREVSSLAHRDELRKLYLEPAFQEVDVLKNAVDNKQIQEFTAEFVKHVRRFPTRQDQIAQEFLTALGNKKNAYARGSSALRRSVISGTMGANARSMVKNMFQSLLTINTIGHRATLAGIESSLTDGGRRLLGKYRVTLGRVPLSAFNVTELAGWQRLATGGFAAVDRYINCAGAGNGALYKLITGSRKHMDELLEYAASKGITKEAARKSQFWDVLADAVDDGHFEDLINLANRNIKMTQWSYRPHDMPKHLWGTTGKNFWMFTSWPSNFYSVHIPQLFKQLVRGENVFGEATDLGQRVALLSFAAKAIYLRGKAEEAGYNMDHLGLWGPAPRSYLYGTPTALPISPITQAGFSFAEGARAVVDLIDDRTTPGQAKRAMERFMYALGPFVPGYTAARHLSKGREDPLAIFLSPSKRKKSRGSFESYPSFPGFGRFPKYR